MSYGKPSSSSSVPNFIIGWIIQYDALLYHVLGTENIKSYNELSTFVFVITYPKLLNVDQTITEHSQESDHIIYNISKSNVFLISLQKCHKIMSKKIQQNI